MQWIGYWNDGLTAARQRVAIALQARRLVLTDADTGHAVTLLPLDGLSLAEEVYRGQPLRFRHAERGEARLTVDDHSLLEAVRRQAPGLGRRYHGRHGTGRRLLLWSGGLAGVVVALLAAVPLLSGPIANLLPVEWEASLGRQVVEGLAGGERCRNPEGRAALRGLTTRLAAVGDSPYQFQVRVVDQEAVNAFAAPGGYIVLFDGLLQDAQGPEEVAAVLAHEMAHVQHRHATRALVRHTGYSLVTALLLGDASGAVSVLVDSGALLLSRAHSRADEAEADRSALDLLHRAGLDSRGLERFFLRLEDEHGDLSSAVALFSTHPLHSERVHQARQLSRAGEAPLDTAAWRALRSICADPTRSAQ